MYGVLAGKSAMQQDTPFPQGTNIGLITQAVMLEKHYPALAQQNKLRSTANAAT